MFEALAPGPLATSGKAGRDTTHGRARLAQPSSKVRNDMKADTPIADRCCLGGWKTPLTVTTAYQQADQVTMRNALINRDQRRAAGSR